MDANFDRFPSEKQRAAEFLRSHLPQSDLDCYDDALWERFVDHALALRSDAPWCAELDEEIFLHYVLFPRVNDEDLSFHRDIFRTALWERVAPLSTTAEKVLEVNRWCCEMASYEMQDERTASPLTVYRCGSGRCGEESTFLVSALRSVGIPARQVYAPRWAHCDDNHAWAEVLCDGKWRFLGACEPEPILDRGWFNSPASRTLLVHSRVFGEAHHPLHGERIGTEWAVTWFNQTARYAFTRRRTLRAEVDGHGAPGAVIQIQVLNEASFHTIATLTADGHGEAQIELGDGDFHIFARCGTYACECRSSDDDVIILPLQPFSPCETDWREVDYIAPSDAPRNPAPLNSEQKRCRAAVLADGRAKRDARIAAMFPIGQEDAPCADLLRAARGNASVIANFLSSGGELREILLRTLSKKDLRDVTAHILESHLRALPTRGSLPEEIYNAYVLCPRIALEPLSPWRESLAAAVADNEKKRWRDDPTALWQEIFARVNGIFKNTYANLLFTPEKAWQAQRCDWRSMRVLYVALLRTIGVPARLRALDGEPEYYHDGEWHNVERPCTATLRIAAESTALYGQNWTLSRGTYGEWTLLHPETDVGTDGTLSIALPGGCYRLVTSVRMPNGNQFSAAREIILRDGEQKDISLYFRPYKLSDLLRCQRLPAMAAVALDGTQIEDICHINARPSLLLWLEEGGEPTEHILNEMLCMENIPAKFPGNIIFLLRSRDALQQRTLSLTLGQIPGAQVLLDDWAYDLESTARHLTCDPDTPPLAVVCDQHGHAVYGMSGYSVGAAELMSRIMQYIANH